MIQTSSQILADQIEQVAAETDFCGVIAVYGPKSEYGRKCATLSTFLNDFNRALGSLLTFELSQTGN